MVVLSKLVTAIVALSSFIPLTLATPITSRGGLETRQSGFWPVTGSTTGGVQPRLEIRTLIQDSVMKNLFLLALARFQAADQKDKLSYYQLSGIHGLPYIAWDGSEGSGDVGYCTHGSNLFGSWHRPYLAAYEQVLSDYAHQVANDFPDGDTKDQYTQAADRIRAPYWDWAWKDGSGQIMHPILTDPSVDVTYPNGSSASMPNPMYQYAFHSMDSNEIPAPYNSHSFTYRVFDGSSSHDEQLEQIFQDEFTSSQPTIYRLLTQWQNFNQFSSSGSDASSQGSLEDIHGSIHVAFQDSWMRSPPAAGFDPIFWLHHANVDRFVALYQRLYPETYVEPAEQFSSTYTIQAGTVTDTNTPLTPFHRNANGDFWTSEEAKSTNTFGYTYPELAGNPDNQTLVETINNLYQTSGISLQSNSADAKRSLVNHDYLARVDLNLNALADSPYAVLIFLGDVPSDSSVWRNSPNYIGSAAAFSKTPGRDVDSRVTVPLAEALRERHEKGDLKSLRQRDILDYLKKNLHWRVSQVAKEISRLSVPNVKVKLVSTKVIPAASKNQFPRYTGGFVEHFDAES